MKNIFLLVLGILFSFFTIAQSNKVLIRIVDTQSNFPLSGANVSVNNSSLKVSDKNGEIQIDCEDSLLIEVSYVGYKTTGKWISCGLENEFVIYMNSESHELGTIEVTAKSNPYHSQLEQPVSIVKLENTELKRGTGLFLDDAINTNVPGVTMQRRSQSGGQQFNIRGYGNGMGIRGISSNFDGQGLKVYYNGIPITDAEGITMLDDIDFGSVNNVEILKGPAGSLYGLAIAGVVNLKTERGLQNKTVIGQDVLYGSYGLFRSTTRLSIGGKHSSVLINYGRQKYDGFMPHTNSKKDFVNMIGEFRIDSKQNFTTYFGYSDSYDQRNGELTEEQYETFDYSGNPKYIKNDAHSAVKAFRAGVGYTYRFSNGFSSTTTLFGSSQIMDNSSAGGWTDKTSLNYGFRSVLEKNIRISELISLSGITGIEAQRMNAQIVGYGMGVDSTDFLGYNIITSIRSDQLTKSFTNSYFSQWTIHLPLKISISAGLGLSNMRINLNDRLWGVNNNDPNNTKQKYFDGKYSNMFSPSFAINKRIKNGVSLYLSYSTAYKAPVASNMVVATTGQLNTDLRPERGEQVELGTKGNLLNSKLYYTIALFNTRFKDKFTAVTVQNPSNTATLYSYIVNGGALNNRGIEFFASYKIVDTEKGFVKHLQPFANFTFSDFKYEKFYFEKVGKNASNQDSTIVENYSGNSVAGVSPVVFNAGVDLSTKPGFYVSMYYNYRSSMPFTSDGLHEANGYQLLNSKLGFKKSIRHFEFDLYVAANNITGSQYYNMVFVNQLPDAYIPAPNEINFFGGVNLKYTF